MKNNKFIIMATIVAACLINGARASAQSSMTVLNEDSIVEIENGVFFDLDKTVSTAAISAASGDILRKTPTANITNTFYGLFPGLTAIQGSGQPGYDAAWLTVRGIGSYNYDSYTVFVDGFQTDNSYFQYLTPAEIESVSILKDAAALAPLGMKGANGAIWIVTKRGKTGKTQIDVQLQTGFQNPQVISKPLQSYEYASLYNEALSNDNGREWTQYYSQSQLDAYQNGIGYNTDWYDEILRINTPFTSTDITFSGGNRNARYFVMGGYVGSNGVYNMENNDTHSNAQLRQYNLRSNFDFTLFGIFEGKIDLGGRIEDRKYPAYDGDNLWNNLERYPNNIYPVRNESGTWTGTPVFPDNPLASITETGYYSTKDRTLQANFSMKEKLDFIITGLYLYQAASFNDWTRGSYNVTKNYARFIGNEQQTNDQNTNYSIYDDWGTNQWNRQQYRFAVGYDKQWGVNTIKSVIDYLQYMYNLDANRNGNAGINTTYGFQNISGRIHYSHKDKYVAELGFSYSGSDNYKKGNRFGFYPAISGAWILSKEDFLKNNQQIDFLKIRASLGESGYDYFSGGRYLYEQYYQYRGSYPTGNSSPIWHGGISQAYIANPDIFAEKSIKYNLGIDLSLSAGLNVTADAFIDKRSGIVTMDNSIPALTGIITPPYRNLGKVTTSGLEISAGYKGSTGCFSYDIGANATYIRDKINYMAELTPPSPYAAQTGKAIGTQIGYKFSGFYDINDFESDGSLKSDIPTPSFGQVQPGDIKYENINNDNYIDERDMIEVGKPDYPNLVYAFYAGAESKGFDFRVLFQGVSGREVNLLNKAWNKVVAFEGNGNVYEWAENRWAYYPEMGIDTRNTATYPRLSLLGNNNNYRTSDFWIKNGAFLKMRTIELGYGFQESVLSKFRINKLRIFINGCNLLTISPLLRDFNMDPETVSGYPGLKSYNFGITIGF